MDDWLPENIYGHAKRLRWLLSHLARDDTVIEFGCGTGSMISLPLAKRGYKVRGIDIDEDSIAYGRRLFAEAGLDPTCLIHGDLRTLNLTADVIVASEVLEHLSDETLAEVMQTFRTVLRSAGRLLVTVPNGYGWFEAESFLWRKLGVEAILKRGGSARHVAGRLLGRVYRHPRHPGHPSTLSSSGHVQRFTPTSLERLFTAHGFHIQEVTGSVMFSGPFSDLLFTGIGPVMRLNGHLGSLFPRAAASYYIAGQLGAIRK